MGLERDDTVFNARCDECDTYQHLGMVHFNTAQVALRQLGWKRAYYIDTAHHYAWSCPKCKVVEHTL